MRKCTCMKRKKIDLVKSALSRPINCLPDCSQNKAKDSSWSVSRRMIEIVNSMSGSSGKAKQESLKT